MRRVQPFYDNPLELAPVFMALITGAGAATGSVLASDYLQNKRDKEGREQRNRDHSTAFATGVAAGSVVQHNPLLSKPLSDHDKKVVLYSGAGLAAVFVLSQFFYSSQQPKTVVYRHIVVEEEVVTCE